MTDKKELRRYFKALRASLSDEERLENSKKIMSSVISTDEFVSSRTVLVFVPVGSEVNTFPLIEYGLSHGKKIAVPYTENGNMTFRYFTDINELTEGEYGIPVIADENLEVDDFSSSVCIVPCLSADCSGMRLGYGGGYYDRFLSSNKEVFSICVCFDCCLSIELPEEKTDVRVDCIITEKQVIGGLSDA